MANFLRLAERQFLLRHVTGVSGIVPLAHLRRAYWMQYLGAGFNPQTPYDQLEIQWLKAFIRNNGGTPPTTNYIQDLWRWVASAGGWATPSKYVNDNKMWFYLNAL